MVWRWTGNEPLSEPTVAVTELADLYGLYVSMPQCVKIAGYPVPCVLLQVDQRTKESANGSRIKYISKVSAVMIRRLRYVGNDQ